jgi:hypothetical protein
VSTSKCVGMEQPRGLHTGSTTMIDIVLAPLSHTYLQIRGLGLSYSMNFHCGGADPEADEPVQPRGRHRKAALILTKRDGMSPRRERKRRVPRACCLT